MSQTITPSSDNQTAHMTAKTFSKLLYLARWKGWKPRQFPESWPLCAWSTTLVLESTHTPKHALVSKWDAQLLRRTLQQLLKEEAAPVDHELYSAIQQLTPLLGVQALRVKDQHTGRAIHFAP